MAPMKKLTQAQAKKEAKKNEAERIKREEETKKADEEKLDAAKKLLEAVRTVDFFVLICHPSSFFGHCVLSNPDSCYVIVR